MARPQTSLAARLTLWFTAAAFLLVATAGFIQYRSLKASLAREDDRELLERLHATLRARPEDRRARAEDREAPIIVRLLDEQCQEVISGGLALPSPSCVAPLTGEPKVRLAMSSDGHQWRVLGARLPDSSGTWVEVLLNSSGDRGVLRAYRDELLLVLAVALLVSAGLGYGIARRGLQPLGALADRMGTIDARSLERRLGNGQNPASQPSEVRRLVVTFDQMLERLQRAFAVLSEFSAELAHELRTPIHVLRQQLEVALQRARTPDEYREVLGSGLEELDRMRRMVDDILFLARAEDPRSVIERAQLELVEEIRAVTEFLSADANDREITLASDVPSGLTVVADRMLLRRALVNVLANALRHTSAGGEVDISAHDTETAVVIEVGDTGEGIDPILLPHVFERHVRGPESRRRYAAGAGLGLAIARGIMSLHGGTAEASSAPGQGTRLTLSFPKRPDEPQSQPTGKLLASRI